MGRLKLIKYCGKLKISQKKMYILRDDMLKWKVASKNINGMDKFLET